ncbi:hypothetical protein DFJ43DRAFT_1041427, partial [Lentinula guzmanii]
MVSYAENNVKRLAMDIDTQAKVPWKGRETSDDLENDKKGLDDTECDSKIEEIDEDSDPTSAMIPQIVRELVDFEDDPTMPVITWRFFFLSGTLTALGALRWLTQMGFFRTTYIPYSIYFVQIAALYFGRFLAFTLPQKQIGLGRLSFDLNPGPFSIKEHVAIVLAYPVLIVLKFATLLLAAMNGWVAVFNAMRKSVEEDAAGAERQMRVFWWAILAFFLWQFLPEYAFPFVSSLAFLCWFSKHPRAQFLGSGLGGAGFLTLTLDWSNIGSQCVYYPYWAQVNVFTS